jgi:arylsulfatase A-like enzyme
MLYPALLLAALAIATPMSIAGVTAPDKPAPPPNIIIILSDTHRADYLGCYGFEGDISPNLDALAATSVLFKRAVAAAPWTKPSIASLFTSLLPQTHRVVDHNGKFWRRVDEHEKTSALPESAITLAEVLKARGYKTAGWCG